MDASPAMLDAARRGRVGEVVRLARRRAGMRQAELAAAIGYSQAAISRIERGTGANAYDIRTLRTLAVALTIPMSLLGICDPPSTDQEGTDPVDRRQFLRTATAAAVAVAAGDAVGALRRVGRGDVEAIQQGIADLRALDQRTGGDKLHNLAALQVQRLRELASHGTYAEDIGTALHAALADALILAGWLSFDSGRHDAARRFYAEAITATHAANADLAQGYTLSLMSMQAQHLGQPREAITLAQAGLRVSTKNGGSRLRSLLIIREARALAMLQDRVGVEQSLRRATRAMEGPVRGFDPAWVDFFDTAELAGAAGTAYTVLGDPARGVSHLRDAVNIVGRTRNRSSWELALARTLTAAGDPAEACTVAAATLPLLSELSSTRVRKQLAEVIDRMAPHIGIPEVRDFTTQAADLGLTA